MEVRYNDYEVDDNLNSCGLVGLLLCLTLLVSDVSCATH
jgi:hypothetical protein